MSLSVDIKISDFHRAGSWAVSIYVGDIEQHVAAAAVTEATASLQLRRRTLAEATASFQLRRERRRQHCCSCGGDGRRQHRCSCAGDGT